MDLCDKCEEKQKYLLEINDGSQVVCTCDDRFSEENVEESQKEDGDMVGVSQSDVGVQTPKRMSSPIKTTDRKMQRMN